MKVENMISKSSGRPVANQFNIWDGSLVYFQSYSTIIVKIDRGNRDSGEQVYLDANKWDYSVTTGKYRNQFLCETKKETEKKIASGEYILTDLN